MSDYLWDRSGVPDPEIEQLEKLLAPLGLQRDVAVRRWKVPWRAVAACLVLGAAAARLLPDGAGQRTDWVIEGSGRAVHAGERLRAAAGGGLALEAGEVGRIELRPGAEIRMVESGPGRQRIQLRQGQMHALIWAPPKQFVVETESARATDLGCQYDLSVDARGDGFLRVETGWVAFQTGRVECFIPAGAACRTTKARGPGIPYFEDARPEFRSALERFEGGGGADGLAAVLANARREDGLTLWHLLGRVDAGERGAVFDRLKELVRLPAAVRREKAVARDGATLDLCWNALGLDDAGWWREWKREWRQE